MDVTVGFYGLKSVHAEGKEGELNQVSTWW